MYIYIYVCGLYMDIYIYSMNICFILVTVLSLGHMRIFWILFNQNDKSTAFLCFFLLLFFKVVLHVWYQPKVDSVRIWNISQWDKNEKKLNLSNILKKIILYNNNNEK